MDYAQKVLQANKEPNGLQELGEEALDKLQTSVRKRNSEEDSAANVGGDAKVRKLLNVKVNEKLLASINNQLIIHPLKMRSMNEENYNAILDCVCAVAKDNDMALQHIEKLEKLIKDERIVFEETRRKVLKSLPKFFGVEDIASIQVGSQFLFANLQNFEIDKLGNLLQNRAHSQLLDHEQFMPLVLKFAGEVGCTSVAQFDSCFKYAVQFLADERGRVRKRTKKKVTVSDVISELGSENKVLLLTLKDQFLSHCDDVSELNAKALPGFSSDIQAAYHFYKHRKIGKEKVTATKYYELIEEIVGCEELKSNMRVSQQGDTVTHTFVNPIKGLRCVVVEPLLSVNNQGPVVATMYYDTKLVKTGCCNSAWF